MVDTVGNKLSSSLITEVGEAQRRLRVEVRAQWLALGDL